MAATKCWQSTEELDKLVKKRYSPLSAWGFATSAAIRLVSMMPIVPVAPKHHELRASPEPR
jgi:hypothetical protein